MFSCFTFWYKSPQVSNWIHAHILRFDGFMYLTYCRNRETINKRSCCKTFSYISYANFWGIVVVVQPHMKQSQTHIKTERKIQSTKKECHEWLKQIYKKKRVNVFWFQVLNKMDNLWAVVELKAQVYSRSRRRKPSSNPTLYGLLSDSA